MIDLRIAVNILFLTLFFQFACENEFTVKPKQEQSFTKIYGEQFQHQAVDIIYHESSDYIFMLVTKAQGPVIGDNPANNDIMIIRTTPDGNNVRYYSTDTEIDEIPRSMIVINDILYITGGIKEADNSTLMLSKFNIAADSFETTYQFPQFGNADGYDLTTDQSNYLWISGSVFINDTSRWFITRHILGQEMNAVEALNNGTSGIIKRIDHYQRDQFFLMAQTGSEENVNMLLQSNTADFAGGKFTEDLPGVAIPGDFIRGFNTLSAVGYFQNTGIDSLPQGTFLLNVDFNNITGDLVTDTQEIINEGTYLERLENFIPRKFTRTPENDHLIYGTSATTNNSFIRLVKINNTHQLVWDRFYGTGSVGEKAGNLIQNGSNELYFNATVVYQGSDPTKVALFKTNSEGHLNF